MGKHNREFALLVGRQASGKTYQLREAIDWYARNPRCHCVHVVDLSGELARSSSFPECVEVRTEREFHAEVARRDNHLPRVALWQDNPESACRMCIEEGACCLVIDEAWSIASAGHTWKGPQELEDIVLRGRHLVAADRQEYHTHLIMATQYPKSIHHYIYEQVETVMLSKLRGELTRKWVRDYVDERALARSDELEKYQWYVATGRRPRWYRVR